jgi:hypothetical protein
MTVTIQEENILAVVALFLKRKSVTGGGSSAVRGEKITTGGQVNQFHSSVTAGGKFWSSGFASHGSRNRRPT